MIWLAITLFTILMVELVLRMPFTPVVASILQTSRKSMKVIGSSRISDHWKEKAVGAYARKTFAGSLRLAVLLGVVLAAALGLIYLIDLALPEFSVFVLSWTGLVVTLVVATAYVMLRNRLL